MDTLTSKDQMVKLCVHFSQVGSLLLCDAVHCQCPFIHFVNALVIVVSRQFICIFLHQFSIDYYLVIHLNHTSLSKLSHLAVCWYSSELAAFLSVKLLPFFTCCCWKECGDWIEVVWILQGIILLLVCACVNFLFNAQFVRWLFVSTAAEVGCL